MSKNGMPKSSLRDPSGVRPDTRDALVAAGLAEFAERGLDAPSLDAICARAGFTRGAFYVHFRDRDALLEAVMEKVIETFLDMVIAGGGGADDLGETVSRFAALVAAAGPGAPRPSGLDIELHRVLDACARSPLLRRRFVDMFAGGTGLVAAAVLRGQQAGVLRGDVHPNALAQVLGMLALGVLTAADNGVAIDVPAARDTVMRLLATPPAAG